MTAVDMMEPLLQTRCFLLDMDGTFYLGNRLLEGSKRFLEVLNQQGKDYLFLTNNSSSHRRFYAEKITRMGVEVAENRVFTSGEATALYLKEKMPAARLFVVGTPALEDEFKAYGFMLTDVGPDAAVLGFDTTLTYQKLWKLCDLVRAGLPYFATHPDYNCPTENGFMPDIGAMIAFVKVSTGREPDQVIGKPNRLIVDSVSKKLGLPLSAMTMIGDRLYTDIALGLTSGIATILVLSGETQLQDVQGSPYQPSYIFENLGAVADWLIEHRS